MDRMRLMMKFVIEDVLCIAFFDSKLNNKKQVFSGMKKKRQSDKDLPLSRGRAPCFSKFNHQATSFYKLKFIYLDFICTSIILFSC